MREQGGEERKWEAVGGGEGWEGGAKKGRVFGGSEQ